MNIRHISLKDYQQYTTFINTNISQKGFEIFLNNVLGELHIIYILEINNKIIGTGTLFVEKKLTYGGTKMGHIENILIDENYRGNGYGENLVKKLLEYAKNINCYRVDLNCTKELESFYNKNNFTTGNISMHIFFSENFK